MYPSSNVSSGLIAKGGSRDVMDGDRGALSGQV